MNITNKEKEKICFKYKEYLEIIDTLGNKVMLQKQLWQYVEAFKIESHYIDFTKALGELEHYQIIKKEQFLNTSNKVIVFKKYAIRYLSGATCSADVGAVPSMQTSERAIISMFKNHYLINKILPLYEQRKMQPTLVKILSYAKNSFSTILYNKNKGGDYFSVFNKEFEALLTSEFQKSFKIMQEQEQTRHESRVKGAMARIGKGKGKIRSSSENALEEVKSIHNNLEKQVVWKLSPKEKKLQEYNIDSMLNAFVYIAKIENEDVEEYVLVITLVHMDIFNKQDLYHIALCISASYHMFKRYFKNTITFKIKYIVNCYDQVAQDNLEADAKKGGMIDAFTKEPSQLNRLQQLFNLNNVKSSDRNSIEVIFTNYNITDTYLDAIKYRNIEKAGGRPSGSKNKPK